MNLKKRIFIGAGINLISVGVASSEEKTHTLLERLAYKEFQCKSGIYTVSKVPGGQKLVYHNNKVTAEYGRVVVICDGIFNDPEDAARDAIKRLKEMNIDPAATIGSFDIFYPGSIGRLDDFMAKNPTDQVNEVALLLVNAMKTVHKDGCNWIAVSGGLVLLAQAMEGLIIQGITLETQLVQLYRPTTSSVKAVHLVHQLGMNMPDDFVRGCGLLGKLDAIRVKIIRVRYENDPYTWKDFVGSILESKKLGIGLIFVGLLLAYLSQVKNLL